MIHLITEYHLHVYFRINYCCVNLSGTPVYFEVFNRPIKNFILLLSKCRQYISISSFVSCKVLKHCCDISYHQFDKLPLFHIIHQHLDIYRHMFFVLIYDPDSICQTSFDMLSISLHNVNIKSISSKIT